MKIFFKKVHHTHLPLKILVAGLDSYQLFGKENIAKYISRFILT